MSVIKGKIVDMDEKTGTATVRVPCDVAMLAVKNTDEAYVEFIDGRHLSDKQRRMCYALIRDIAEWVGDSERAIKEQMKLEFWTDHLDTLRDKIFSLSDAPMSLVAEFQKFLISFILDNDVPTKMPLRDYVDDIEHYTFMCVIHKRCVICGSSRVDLHHCSGSRVGPGNNREKIHNLGREVISLCRIHHQEIESMYEPDFWAKYHLNGGIIADESICKLYKLNK